MRFATRRLFSVLTPAILMMATLSVAADKQQPSPEDMQRAMEAWMKSATPGARHQALARMAGEWSYGMKMYGMGEEPMESTGSMKSEMILDGRYLQMSIDGTMMGMPFKGTGLMAYDNFGERYQMAWVDNMTTAIIMGSGSADNSGNVITFMGKMNEPATGERDKDVRYVFRVTDNNHHSMEAWDLIGTPQEFKAFEINYTRR